MDFSSDNTAGASQAILAKIVAANEGPAPAYGVDPLTIKAARLLCEIFQREIACFLVNTETAANALALGAISPPFGAIFCHAHAHVMEDECGAPARRLVPLPSDQIRDDLHLPRARRAHGARA